MKLIVEIPEDVKEKIAIMGLDRLDVWNIRSVSKAISDGIPLDDIKAEIKSMYHKVEFMDEHGSGYNSALDDVVEVINKYIGEKKQR